MKDNEQFLSAEYLRERLSYCPASGVLRWRRNNNQAGHVTKLGYVAIRVNKRLYLAHRLIWVYVYGAWPQHEIDHKNGIGHDNRVENLREATHAENMQNSKKRTNNSSGYSGVSFRKRSGKWRADIQADGRQHFLGEFHSKEQARDAYLNKKKELHKFQPIPRA